MVWSATVGALADEGAPNQTQSFSTICQLAQTGQVTIDNPSTFGAGSGSTVTVKITKLGRSR
jgi:hypothetical protein